MNTTTTISELELRVFAGGMCWDTVVLAGEVDVDVEFDIYPGQRAIIHADPEHCQPGFQPCANIYKIVTKAPLKFENEGIELTIVAGTDIFQMIPKAALEALADEVLEEAELEAFA